jgi:hypothetical protein
MTNDSDDRPQAVAFIDFEASGLMNGSFPIEAGWAIADRRKTKPVAGSMLIRHDPWMERVDLWSWRAVEIHRIDRRALLMMGKPVEVAAKAMAEALDGFDVVYTDNPEFDSRWCQMLFNAAKIPVSFAVKDWHLTFSDNDTNETEFERLYRHGAIHKIAPRTHRAKDDAYSMAMLWLLSRQKL